MDRGVGPDSHAATESPQIDSTAPPGPASLSNPMGTVSRLSSVNRSVHHTLLRALAFYMQPLGALSKSNAVEGMAHSGDVGSINAKAAQLLIAPSHIGSTDRENNDRGRRSIATAAAPLDLARCLDRVAPRLSSELPQIPPSLCYADSSLVVQSDIRMDNGPHRDTPVHEASSPPLSTTARVQHARVGVDYDRMSAALSPTMNPSISPSSPKARAIRALSSAAGGALHVPFDC